MIVRADAPGTYGSHARVYARYATDAESLERALDEWDSGESYYYYDARPGDRVLGIHLGRSIGRAEIREMAEKAQAERDAAVRSAGRKTARR